MVHVVVLLPRSMIVTILPPSKALKQSTRSVELSLHFTSSHLGGEGESADSHVENMQPRQAILKVEGAGLPVISRPSLPPNKLEEGYITAHMAAMTCC